MPWEELGTHNVRICRDEPFLVPFPVGELRTASPGAPLRSAPATTVAKSRETDELDTAPARLSFPDSMELLRIIEALRC
jgi:hypothetical protein